MEDEIYYNEDEHEPKIIEMGCYEGRHYFIRTFGAHPVAYVQVDYGKDKLTDYDDIQENVSVHGGFSYEGRLPFDCGDDELNRFWYVGWDYAHCGDWQGFFTEQQNLIFGNVKHTHEEIKKDVINVIKQLNDGGFPA